MSTTPVMQGQIRVSDPRRLLVERAAVLLRRMFQVVVRGWARWRKRAGSNRRAANGGGLGVVMGAAMGRALAARGARSRMLVVEERLTLGPKQHMYVIRCGEQRLLVASAGEAALQWTTLPEDAGKQATEACENTLFAEVRSVTSAKRRQGSPALKARSKAKSGGPAQAGKGKAAKAGAEGAR